MSVEKVFSSQRYSVEKNPKIIILWKINSEGKTGNIQKYTNFHISKLQVLLFMLFMFLERIYLH
jgi:hypothetical protein